MPELLWIQQVAAQVRQAIANLDTAVERAQTAALLVNEARKLIATATYGSQADDVAQTLNLLAVGCAQIATTLEQLHAARAGAQRFLNHLEASDQTTAPAVPPSPTMPTRTGSSATPPPPAFLSPEWIATVRKYLKGKHVTTGLAFDDQGNRIGPEIRSGRDDLADAAQDFLVRSAQFPRVPGGAKIDSTDHVETKYAMWMRLNPQQEHITVVINHEVMCGSRLGCQRAVRAILPRGRSMTVISSASGLTWELRGVAPS